MTDRELLENMLSEIKSMKSDMQGMKTDIQGVKSDMQGMKDDIQGVKVDMHGMQGDIQGMKIDMQSMKIQQQENTSILRALEHSAEVNKAEHDRMFNDIDHMKGHLKNIDESLDAVKEILGRHEVDIAVLKRRPV